MRKNLPLAVLNVFFSFMSRQVVIHYAYQMTLPTQNYEWNYSHAVYIVYTDQYWKAMVASKWLLVIVGKLQSYKNLRKDNGWYQIMLPTQNDEWNYSHTFCIGIHQEPVVLSGRYYLPVIILVLVLIIIKHWGINNPSLQGKLGSK